MLDSLTSPTSAASPRHAVAQHDTLPLHSTLPESQTSLVIESLLQTALWILRIFIIFLGHPIVLLCYLFSLSGKEISGVKTFTQVKPDVTKINLGLYVALTLPVFFFWLLIQLIVLNSSFTSFDMDKFLSYETSLLSEIVAIPGMVNLWIFATDGMDGHTFCCFFFVPMVIASIGYVVLWFVYLTKSFDSSSWGNAHIRCATLTKSFETKWKW